jgi:hypothetical protein
MIIRRVVFVITGLDHLIDEPAVNSLVEMRRLNSEQENSQERAKSDDEPRRPIDLRGARLPIAQPLLNRGKIHQRGLCYFSYSSFISHKGHKGAPRSQFDVDGLVLIQLTVDHAFDSVFQVSFAKIY